MKTGNKKKKIEADLCAFELGSHVRVIRLKKIGIIGEVMSKARYRVCVGSLVITCSASELTTSSVSPVLFSKIGLPKISAPPATLDLHGDTVEEALRKLESWLDRAVLANLSKIKVIHGLGSGKVQKAVHHYLTGLSAVVSYKINSFNPGETDIYL